MVWIEDAMVLGAGVVDLVSSIAGLSSAFASCGTAAEKVMIRRRQRKR